MWGKMVNHYLVWLVGMPKAFAKLAKSLGEDAEINIEFKEMGELPKRVRHKPNAAVFSPLQDGICHEVRERAGKAAFCVCCAAAPAELTADDLATLDDLWEVTDEKFWPIKLKSLIGRLELEERYWLSHTCWQSTINMVPDLIWYKDLKGAHNEINDAFCHAVGKEKDDIRGRGHYYIWGLTPEDYAKGEYVCMETEEEVISSCKVGVFDEKVKLQKEGLRDFKTYKGPMFDCEGNVFGTVGVAKDVTNERRYWRQLFDLAHKDSLTGLYNRRYFYEFAQSERGARPMCVLGIDLDHFKQVNDTYGHKAGDEALVLVSHIMRDVFQDGLVCRFSGDEFSVLYMGELSLKQMEAVANAFLKTLMVAFAQMPQFAKLSASIGIAMTHKPDMTIDQLIQRSDEALYKAKEAGRACCYVSEKND